MLPARSDRIALEINEQLDTFKSNIQRGIIDTPWPALLNAVSQYKRYDVLDIICARDALVRSGGVRSPLQSVYFCDDSASITYIDCAQYIFKKFEFAQIEVANRLGVSFELRSLTDAVIVALLNIDKSLLKLNSSSVYNHSLYNHSLFDPISDFIYKNHYADHLSIVIKVIEDLYKKGVYENEDVFKRFAYPIKAKVDDPKMRALLVKGMHYKNIGNRFSLICEALKCFIEVAKQYPDAAEDALRHRNSYRDHYIPENSQKLTLLGYFAIAIATIARKKLSRGFLCCRSPEKIARTHINPFIEQVKLLIQSTENPDENLKNLRQLIYNLPSSNPLQKTFNSYADVFFFGYFLMNADLGNTKSLRPGVTV